MRMLSTPTRLRGLLRSPLLGATSGQNSTVISPAVVLMIAISLLMLGGAENLNFQPDISWRLIHFTESAGTILMLMMPWRWSGRSGGWVGVVAIFSSTS